VIERRDGRLRLVKKNIALDIDNMAGQINSINDAYASTENKEQYVEAGLSLLKTIKGEFLPDDDYLPIVLATPLKIKTKLERFRVVLEREHKSQLDLSNST